MTLDEFTQGRPARYIMFDPEIAHAVGCPLTALVLCQCLFAQKRAGIGIPWAYSLPRWKDVTGISRNRLRRIFDTLEADGLLKRTTRGLPRRSFWSLDVNLLYTLVAEKRNDIHSLPTGGPTSAHTGGTTSETNGGPTSRTTGGPTSETTGGPASDEARISLDIATDSKREEGRVSAPHVADSLREREEQAARERISTTLRLMQGGGGV